MLVRQVVTNADTGETTEVWVEMPDVVTAEEQAAIDAANAAAEATATASTSTLEQQALDALVNLRAYRDAPAPTNAQTIACVKLLCRVAIALIRFRLNKLDATD